MATHSSTLAWKIPWTEKPGRLQSMGSLGVGHLFSFHLFSFFIFFSIMVYYRIFFCFLSLQCCIGFFHATMWISHNHTYVPSLVGLPPLPPSHSSRSSQSAWLGSLCYIASHQPSTLHMIVYMLILLEVKWKSVSCVQFIVTPWTIQSMKFSRLEYWSE